MHFPGGGYHDPPGTQFDTQSMFSDEIRSDLDWDSYLEMEAPNDVDREGRLLSIGCATGVLEREAGRLVAARAGGGTV